MIPPRAPRDTMKLGRELAVICQRQIGIANDHPQSGMTPVDIKTTEQPFDPTKTHCEITTIIKANTFRYRSAGQKETEFPIIRVCCLGR
jgi:hypothetical protein